jgi:hypothetical protein
MKTIMEPKPEIQKENWLLAENFTRQFIQRPDLYARQLDDGSYVCVYRKFSTGLMYAHLKGAITLGAYILNSDSQAKFTVLDADDAEGFDKLKNAAEDLAGQGAAIYLETSRRGGHLWLFHQEQISGTKARNFGLGLVKAYELDKIEVYPKQDKLVDGPGSLIRVPLGIHRKTGHRYGFITPAGESLGELMDQIHILAHPQTVPGEIVEMYQKKEPEHAYIGRNEKFKDVLLIDFLSQYIELRPVASGAVGKCPFHDDDKPSFGVNKKGNYWNCFAGCGGGDIISFWMKYKQVDYPEAIKELTEMIRPA